MFTCPHQSGLCTLDRMPSGLQPSAPAVQLALGAQEPEGSSMNRITRMSPGSEAQEPVGTQCRRGARHLDGTLPCPLHSPLKSTSLYSLQAPG